MLGFTDNKHHFAGFPKSPFGRNLGFSQPAHMFLADPRYCNLDTNDKVISAINLGYKNSLLIADGSPITLSSNGIYLTDTPLLLDISDMPTVFSIVFIIKGVYASSGTGNVAFFDNFSMRCGRYNDTHWFQYIFPDTSSPGGYADTYGSYTAGHHFVVDKNAGKIYVHSKGNINYEFSPSDADLLDSNTLRFAGASYYRFGLKALAVCEGHLYKNEGSRLKDYLYNSTI